LEQLREERFIVSAAAPGPEIHDYITNRLSGVTRPRIDLLPVGREPLMAIVGLGLGVSLISYSSTGVSYPDVRYAELEGEHLAFSAVWSPQNDNPALRRFLSDARLLSKRYAAQRESLDPLP